MLKFIDPIMVRLVVFLYTGPACVARYYAKAGR